MSYQHASMVVVDFSLPESEDLEGGCGLQCLAQGLTVCRCELKQIPLEVHATVQDPEKTRQFLLRIMSSQGWRLTHSSVAAPLTAVGSSE